jgi:hypothetical protein
VVTTVVIVGERGKKEERGKVSDVALSNHRLTNISCDNFCFSQLCQAGEKYLNLIFPSLIRLFAVRSSQPYTWFVDMIPWNV